MGKLREYEHDGVRITYDAQRCIHAAECVRGLPSVFDTNRRPWIDPAGASGAQIAEVVRRCPTGALQYDLGVEGDAETADEPNALTIAENGPVYARGDIELLDSNHELIGRETRVAFCRCGASNNKPWCDGSHGDIGFEAPASPREARLKPLPDPASAPLKVRIRANGPLVLEGPFRLSGHGSREYVAGGGCALCRCGASGNKPWCDGSHNAIDFVAEDPKAG